MATNAVYVYRDYDYFGIWEPFTSARIAVHEEAHAVRKTHRQVILEGEHYIPGSFLTSARKEDEHIFVGKIILPKSGFVFIDNKTGNFCGGSFIEEAMAEYTAGIWAKNQLISGNYPEVTSQIKCKYPDFDSGDPEKLWVETEDSEGNKYPVPAIFLTIKSSGKKAFSGNILAGACFWMIAKKDPKIVEVAAKAKIGNLEALRELPCRINRLLGSHAYVFLRDGKESLVEYKDRYWFIKNHFGF